MARAAKARYLVCSLPRGNHHWDCLYCINDRLATTTSRTTRELHRQGWSPATDEGQVGLLDLALGEGCAESGQRRPRLGYHHQTACGLIQPVHLHRGYVSDDGPMQPVHDMRNVLQDHHHQAAHGLIQPAHLRCFRRWANATCTSQYTCAPQSLAQCCFGNLRSECTACTAHASTHFHWAWAGCGAFTK